MIIVNLLEQIENDWINDYRWIFRGLRGKVYSAMEKKLNSAFINSWTSNSSHRITHSLHKLSRFSVQYFAITQQTKI